MKRFSIPPREERERHSHTMSAYKGTLVSLGETIVSMSLKLLFLGAETTVSQC
jgi:hypothetical protein